VVIDDCCIEGNPMKHGRVFEQQVDKISGR
jgi:hypothetical protein